MHKICLTVNLRELYLRHTVQYCIWRTDECYLKHVVLKGQSHKKVCEMSVWGISLGPN
jgi:hypothetical protein